MTFEIREMHDEDVDEVIGLLTSALGPAPGGVDRRALFEWKHFANPFGRSIALVAEEEGRIIGLRAFMRWGFTDDAGAKIRAVRAVDTATDPSAQRRGVFTGLTKAALEECRRHNVGLVFNTPNAKSLPGYRSMGWEVVAKWPMWIKVAHPGTVASAALRRDLASGEALPLPAGTRLRPASEAFEGSEIAAFSERMVVPHGCLQTPRDAEYLRWRYARGPVQYAVLTVGESPSAVAVVRLRRRGSLREAEICELLSTTNAGAAGAEALRRIPKEASADHAVTHLGPGWRGKSRLKRAGYRRIPRAGMTFAVRLVEGGGIVRDVLGPDSWSLTLGDLELF